MAPDRENAQDQSHLQPSQGTPSSHSRRAAIKKMVAGTGVAAAAALPNRWTKPVVDRVLVPAHAATSPAPTTTVAPTTTAAPTTSVAPTTTAAPTTTVAPTTTLCEIGGVYCWIYEPEEFFMEISVGTDGSVAVSTNCCGNGDDNVGADGGSFFVELDGVTVEGEVVCNSSSVSGTVTFNGGQPVDFEATPELCSQAPSDIRLKTDIQPVGITSNGFKLYRYRYIDDPSQQPYVGVMAQDLASTHPEALVEDDRGFYAVRYGVLNLRMATFEQWRQCGLKSVELVH